MNLLQFKASSKKNLLEKLKIINWEVICILIVFFLTGCTILHSASGGNFYPLVKNHAIKFIFSSIVFAFILLINYTVIKKISFSPLNLFHFEL